MDGNARGHTTMGEYFIYPSTHPFVRNKSNNNDNSASNNHQTGAREREEKMATQHKTANIGHQRWYKVVARKSFVII